MAAFLDVEGAERAARRLESAAESAHRAADRLEEVTRQLTVLVGSGYGNNVETLIEKLTNYENSNPKSS